MTLQIILQLALSGLSIGSIYALVGLALVLPFKASGVVNFAQGEIVTFGAYLALILSGLGLPISRWSRSFLWAPLCSAWSSSVS
jgi:branched-chain amino acid transport system permease protein